MAEGEPCASVLGVLVLANSAVADSNELKCRRDRDEGRFHDLPLSRPIGSWSIGSWSIGSWSIGSWCGEDLVRDLSRIAEECTLPGDELVRDDFEDEAIGRRGDVGGDEPVGCEVIDSLRESWSVDRLRGDRHHLRRRRVLAAIGSVDPLDPVGRDDRLGEDANVAHTRTSARDDSSDTREAHAEIRHLFAADLATSDRESATIRHLFAADFATSDLESDCVPELDHLETQRKKRSAALADAVALQRAP